jgi:hypothetical protein
MAVLLHSAVPFYQTPPVYTSRRSGGRSSKFGIQLRQPIALFLLLQAFALLTNFSPCTKPHDGLHHPGRYYIPLLAHDLYLWSAVRANTYTDGQKTYANPTDRAFGRIAFYTFAVDTLL